jgi:NAD(P)-dependent dehydrogenase (short-subunit alcohol dehydrogenase family)
MKNKMNNQKHILITGGHSGIGLELTKLLVKDGHKVGLILKNENRKSELLKEFKNLDIFDFFFADLSSHRDILKMCDEIKASWSEIDILFNNAGVLLPELQYSAQGNEMHFEVNTLAPYFLTIHLKELFENTSYPSIINTVTDTLENRTNIDVRELKKPKNFRKLFGSYMQSKFALTLLMNDLAADWKNVCILNVSPGPNKTKMTSGSGMPFWLKPLRNLFFAKPTKGAGFLYDAAFDKRFEKLSGVYIQNNKIKNLKIKLEEKDKVELLKEIQ